MTKVAVNCGDDTSLPVWSIAGVAAAAGAAAGGRFLSLGSTGLAGRGDRAIVTGNSDATTSNTTISLLNWHNDTSLVLSRPADPSAASSTKSPVSSTDDTSPRRSAIQQPAQSPKEMP